MSKALDIKYQNRWTGYKNYKDITSLLPTDLAPGSNNIIIQDGSKLETRGGSRYFGAQGTIGVNTDPSWTLANRIHSHYDSFVNNQGITMPFRVFYSGTTTQGDVLEVWLPEYVSGVPQSTKKWYQVSPTAPSSPIVSTHKWYWAEWYDSQDTQNRIVFTYGTTDIGSYTGGFAPIVAVGAGTITTDDTWRSKGFIEAPEGVDAVVINGVTYTLSSGDFSTNTINVASSVGVSVDDVAFQSLNFDATTWGTADVCSAINNQVYYIDWNQRNVFLSWNRNRRAYLGTTTYLGTSGLDDAIFSGPFTGTSTDTYVVSIDTVAPNTQTYSGVGSNDASFTTTGYTGTGTNTYKVSVVADFSFTFVGVPAITPAPGDILVGGTSGATGKVIFLDSGGQDPVLQLTSDKGFVPGEAITGTQGAYGTVATASGQDWVQCFKNGVSFVPGAFAAFVAYQFLVGTVTNIIDGLDFVVGTTNTGDNWATHDIGDFWELTIGDTDTFTWSLNGTNQASQIPITLAAQALGTDGIDVTFVKDKGHKLGDSWTMTAYQAVIKGWRDFIFSQPTRLPGEGFRLQLESNGWTMKPQEANMYINGQAGEYYEVIVTASSDNTQETITARRLKTEPRRRALYPYLINFNNNYMSIVSQEKTWDILGRQKFLELPQAKSISDQVKYDFYSADWEDGELFYAKRKQFFIIPRTGSIFIYDEFMKYWHPPQSFARRISSMAWIDGELIGHSYERNESYVIFSEDRNDLDVYPISTNITTPYYDFGKRFNQKETASIVIDGYIEASPVIKWKVNFGVGGCEGIEQGQIDPAICYPLDTASLGKSGLGFHGFGNSVVDVIPHFTYGKTFNNLTYYLRNIEITCNSMDQRWAITSLGHNVGYNTVVNSNIFNTQNPY